MTQFEIDTHIFIDEIQRRPALWDPRSDLYMNKIIRKKSWEDMVLIFGDSDDTIENKQILGKYIIILYIIIYIYMYILNIFFK